MLLHKGVYPEPCVVVIVLSIQTRRDDLTLLSRHRFESTVVRLGGLGGNETGQYNWKGRLDPIARAEIASLPFNRNC
jgi:hypothetical protein